MAEKFAFTRANLNFGAQWDFSPLYWRFLPCSWMSSRACIRFLRRQKQHRHLATRLATQLLTLLQLRNQAMKKIVKGNPATLFRYAAPVCWFVRIPLSNTWLHRHCFLQKSLHTTLNALLNLLLSSGNRQKSLDQSSGNEHTDPEQKASLKQHQIRNNEHT